MTKSELERLAVVETLITTIQGDVSTVKSDVTEVKADIKSILIHQAKGTGALALVSRTAPWVAVLISAIALVRS